MLKLPSYVSNLWLKTDRLISVRVRVYVCVRARCFFSCNQSLAATERQLSRKLTGEEDHLVVEVWDTTGRQVS